MAYDEQLAERVRDLLGDEAGVTEKRMFGGLAFLVEERLTVAASSHGGLMVRVDPAQEDDLLADPHVEPVVMRGRPMSGWLHVRPAGVAAEDDLGRWVRRGVERARSLPAG